MAKNKVAKRRRSNGGFKFPIAVAAGFAPGVIKVYEHSKEGVSAAVREAGRIYLGLDFWEGKWDWRWMMFGTMPILLGALVHKYAGNRLGINRALAKSGIPIIRL